MSNDSDMAEVGRALKELAKERRESRYDQAVADLPWFESFLASKSLKLHKCGDYHWQIRDSVGVLVIDYWPSTGKSIVAGTRKWRQKASHGGMSGIRRWLGNYYGY